MAEERILSRRPHTRAVVVAAMPMLEAPALIWECVKHHNSFMRKNCKNIKGVPTLSSDKGNLCGLHSFKFSGLANRDVLDVSSKKTGAKETIIMTTTHRQQSRLMRPKHRLIETGVKKQATKGTAQLTKALLGRYYRRDLAALAKTKYQKVRTSFKTKKLNIKSRRAPK